MFLQLLTLIVICGSFQIAKSQVSIGGYNVYFGSLHNHTSYSDGSGTPVEAYNYARDIGQQDFFALADHSEMLTSSEWASIKSAANNANQDGVFTALYGFEWSSIFSGHVAVFNTEDLCSYLSYGSFDAVLTWVNARNAIAFFNHPGWSAFAFNEFDHFTDSPSDKFVGMELWNDHDGFSNYYYNDGYYSNDGNKGYFDEALIRNWKIGASGSDDNHSATWGTATQMRMAILANANTRTELLNALTARRFFSSEDKNIGLSFKLDGSEMGSYLQTGTYTASIQATDADNEVFTLVQLIKNGVVVNNWFISATSPVISQNLTCALNDYYYVKVTQADGNEAISSPIFITSLSNQPPVVQITSPANGATFTSGSNIPIVASASDPDGTINKVEFYQGTVKLGEDNSSPYQYDWLNVQNGTYTLTAKAFDNAGLSTTSSSVSISVITPSNGSISKRITQGMDDAEEGKSGNVVLNGDDLELVYDTKQTGNQTVGLRFGALGIPAGATITNAYLQFTVDEKSTAACTLLIKGEASDNAAQFSNTLNNISGRPKTSSSVSWVPLPWKTVGASGASEKSPDLKNIIQEIVNRSGWTPDGNLVLIITGTGKRVARSFEGNPSQAALLHVEYSTARSGMIEQEKVVQATQNDTEAQFTLFPNPVSGKLTIREDTGNLMKSVVVINSVGKIIEVYNPVNIEFVVDCLDYAPGLYFIKVETDKSVGIKKFIKL